VIDSDADGEPGFTAQFTGASENFVHSRIRDASQIVNGLISPDGRHSAQLVAAFDSYQLSCAVEPCNRSSVQSCELENNTVRFLPLPARGTEYACEDALKALDASAHVGLGPLNATDC
jgi:hypothetical protein